MFRNTTGTLGTLGTSMNCTSSVLLIEVMETSNVPLALVLTVVSVRLMVGIDTVKWVPVKRSGTEQLIHTINHSSHMHMRQWNLMNLPQLCLCACVIIHNYRNTMIVWFMCKALSLKWQTSASGPPPSYKNKCIKYSDWEPFLIIIIIHYIIHRTFIVPEYVEF